MIFVQPAIVSTRETPSELYVCPWTVIVDTREQAPWGFTGMELGRKLVVVKKERRALNTGDYSIVGIENKVCIERKSADDLVGSVCGGHARLQREHERMAEMVVAGGSACLIVEGCYSQID